MASVLDEKCREKEKGVLNRRKPVLNPTIQHVTEIYNLHTRTVRKSDYTPALALSKHMASVFDEKSREKEKGELNRRKAVLNPTIQHVTVIYITNFYPTIHIVLLIL